VTVCCDTSCKSVRHSAYRGMTRPFEPLDHERGGLARYRVQHFLTRRRTRGAEPPYCEARYHRPETLRPHRYRGPGGRCVSRYRTMSMRTCSDVPSPSPRPWLRRWTHALLAVGPTAR
jgi:hypothetical protein